MKRIKSNWKKRIGMAVFIIVALVFFYWSYTMGYRQKTEPKLDAAITNTNPTLYSLKKQMHSLEKYEELYRLAFEGRALEKDYGMISIPGLISTRTLSSNRGGDIQICSSMTPQGLCIAGEFLLISAYCHTQTHNSVIYVLNKNTHEFIKEIVLKDKNHVGGLAFDNEHLTVWVSTSHNGRAAASGFSLDRLLRYDLDKAKRPIVYTYDYRLYTLEKDSFMSYDRGYLYIGHFSDSGPSVVQKFQIDKDGSLTTRNGIELGIDRQIAIPEEVKLIPARTQGFALYGDYVFMTQSYGMTRSKLLIHKYSDFMYRTDTGDVVEKIVMPQKLQQIYIDGKDLYILFESAAYAYRTQPFSKVDRVLKLDLDKIFEVQKEKE